MQVLPYLLINGFAVFLGSYILPGVDVDNFLTAILVAAVLGVINAFIKPILIILTLPITIITLGLFTFVINAFLILFTGRLIPGFHVESFWWALLFSLVISFVSSFLSNLSKNR